MDFLTPSVALLQKETILSLLNPQATQIFSRNMQIFQTIDSTNLEAKRLLNKDSTSLHGTVILAEHQSAGRGRLGRSFYSPQNTGLYVSIVYNATEYVTPHIDPLSITVRTAVAVRRALAYFDINAKIKWVNDLFVDNKKVCGILTEGIFANGKNGVQNFSNFIIGIGINILEQEGGFPVELKNIAGSLKKNINRNQLIAHLLNHLEHVLSQPFTEILNDYKENSLVLGKHVIIHTPNETFSAKVIEITNEAHLLVEREDGICQEILSGEVSLRMSHDE